MRELYMLSLDFKLDVAENVCALLSPPESNDFLRRFYIISAIFSFVKLFFK